LNDRFGQEVSLKKRHLHFDARRSSLQPCSVTRSEWETCKAVIDHPKEIWYLARPKCAILWLRSGPIVIQMGAVSATTVVQRTDTVLRFRRCESMFLVLMLPYDKDSCQSSAAERISYHI
jgi:hypothetical protein